MSWNATIKVVTQSGNPVRGAKVSIAFSGIIGTHATEYTGSSGQAEFRFDSINDFRLGVDKIWINSREVDSSLGLDRGTWKTYVI